MKDKCLFMLTLLPAAVVLSVAACGGAGRDGPPGDQAMSIAPVPGLRVNAGPISAFGSVFVNGVEYDTHHAEILIDGAPRLENDLHIGMVVKVTGTVGPDGTKGKALRIEFNDDVQGAIDAIDLARKRLVVLGQPVRVDKSTVFDGPSLTELAAGNVVEVSGLVDSAGVVHATHIELKADAAARGDVQDVKGVVEDLDEHGRRFTLHGQPVDYTAAAVKGAARLSDGMPVEVDSTAGRDVNGVLIASAVQVMSQGVQVPAGVADVQLEGLVTSFASTADFAVAGQPVRAGPGTRYANGTATDLAVDARIQVAGTMDSGGVLHAATVTIKPAGAPRMAADEGCCGGRVETAALAATSANRGGGPRDREAGGSRI